MLRPGCAAWWLLLILGIGAGGVAGVWVVYAFRHATSERLDASDDHSESCDGSNPSAGEDVARPPESPPAPSKAAAETPSSSPPTIKALIDEELSVARQLVKQFPENANALALLGNVYAGRGDSTEAVKCWWECLRLDPRCARAYNSLGMVALKKGEHEEAVALWKKAVELDPTMAGAHGGLARALLSLGKPTEAVAELERDLQISPQSSMSHFLLGQAHFQLGDYQKAKESYKQAVQLQPDFWNACYGLYNACQRLGESDKAQEYREKFQKLKAEESKVYVRDVTTFDDLADSSRRLAETLTSAGQLYRSAGDLKAAQEHWRRAAELAPKQILCRTELAALYQRINQPLEALPFCEQLAQIEPHETIHRVNIGVLNVQLQRFDAAAAAFQKVIELAPKRAEGYCLLARLYLKTRQKLPEARTLAQEAVRLEPTAANYFLLGEAHDRNGDRQGALAALERAMTMDPDNAQYRRVYTVVKERK